ncbi:MAG: hypothetical protein ACYSU0_09075 [Planctomycetota bacterium]|jgi:hypothetical protein
MRGLCPLVLVAVSAAAFAEDRRLGLLNRMPEVDGVQPPVEKMLVCGSRVYAHVAGRLCAVDAEKDTLRPLAIPYSQRVLDACLAKDALHALSGTGKGAGLARMEGDKWTDVPAPEGIPLDPRPVLLAWKDTLIVFADERVWRRRAGKWDVSDVPLMYPTDGPLYHYWRVGNPANRRFALHDNLLLVGWGKGEFGHGLVALDLDREEKKWRRIDPEEIAPETSRLPREWSADYAVHNPLELRHGPEGRLWLLTGSPHLRKVKSIFRFDGAAWERVRLPTGLGDQPHVKKRMEADGGRRRLVPVESYWVRSLAFGPKGKPYLLSGSNGMYILEDGKLRLLFDCGRVYGHLAIDERGNVFIGTRGVLVFVKNHNGYVAKYIPSVAAKR